MLLSLGFLLVSFKPIYSSGCGKRPPGMRVIGGENAVQNSWPWQMSVALGQTHICGGSLIDPKWVVTSAHCVNDFPFPSLYIAVAGGHRLYGKTPFQQIIRVKDLHIHQNFNRKSLKNDIALLELERPVMMSPQVNTICLPQATDGSASEHSKCYITGWGATETGTSARYLREARLNVVNHKQCYKKNIKYHPVDEKSMICAGYRSQRGGCDGDSGGPLACQEYAGRWVLRGVVSWGREDCSPKYYTVFARVSTFVPWIEDIMAGNDGSSTLECSVQDSEVCPHLKHLCSKKSVVRKMCPKVCDSCDEAEGNGNSVDCSNVPPVCYSWKPRCKETIVARICATVCQDLCPAS